MVNKNPTQATMDLEMDWNVIESYFSQTKHFMTCHHLDSYNDFVNQKIGYTIKTLNPFTIQKNDPKTNHSKYRFDVWVGGKEGDRIYLDRPSYPDGDVLFPAEARINDMDYVSTLYADVVIDYVTYYGKSEHVKTHEILKVNVGTIPIMVRSKLCALFDLPDEKLIQLGECPYDQGGYFVMRGKEKVIIAQERIATNQLYLKTIPPDHVQTVSSEFMNTIPKNLRKEVKEDLLHVKNFHDANEHSHEAFIRCVSKENSLFPKTIKFYVHAPYKPRRNAVTLSLINIGNGKLIPVFALFRMLGVETDRDIVEMIVGKDMNTPLGKNMMDFLYGSVTDCIHIRTRDEALNAYKDSTQYKSKENLELILIEDVFPNIGNTLYHKALYLGCLMRRLVLFILNNEADTDRDNYAYKRVDLTGFLLWNLFRDFYNQFRNNVRGMIDQSYEYGAIKSTGSIDEFHGDILRSIHKIFDSSLVRDGMIKSLRGNWGMSDDPEKMGIVQDLNRLSYMGYVSHVRRVNTPIDRSVKIAAPHYLHSTQWGMMCPIESPDGGNIGLLKHLAVLCRVTSEVDEDMVIAILRSLGVATLDDIKNDTRVFINGSWIGDHSEPNSLVEQFKQLRRSGKVSPFVSVAWNIIKDEIHFYSDSGRCIRPLYIVQDRLKEKIRALLSKKDFTWWGDFIGYDETALATSITEVRGGGPKKPRTNANAKTNAKAKAKAKANDIADIEDTVFDSVEENDGKDTHTTEESDSVKDTKNDIQTNRLIEYVDVYESYTILVAMHRTDVTQSKTEAKAPIRYSHSEIHPSTMLSIYSNTIPLADHNQAPRNIFSGAQGKQAIGVYATNFNSRIDTATYILNYPQRALVETRYHKHMNAHRLPNGSNLIVAICTYTGYNQEDAVIINEDSIRRGLFNITYYKSYKDMETIDKNTGEQVLFKNPWDYEGRGITPKLAKWSTIDSEGMPKLNAYIGEDDVFLGRVKTTLRAQGNPEDNLNMFQEDDVVESYEDRSIVGDRVNNGIIDKIHVIANEDKTRTVKLRFRKPRLPVLGDKMASRHGQKGTVGMILPCHEMPYTKDGVVPDMIINPHALPSRMTIGHLLETVFAKLGCMGDMCIDGTVFEHHDLTKVGDALESLYGYERYGNEIMYNGRTGEQMPSSIFLGPTYYYRLKHMVKDKVNYRSTGGVTTTTRQPTKGRAAGGGLRNGEMEKDGLVSHGIMSFLNESIMKRSDEFGFFVDNIHGSIAKYQMNMGSKSKQTSVESMHGNDTLDFSHVKTPFAFKQMVTELEAMGVATRIYTDDRIEDEYQNCDLDYVYKDDNVDHFESIDTRDANEK
jgi:DNA-directed RNA polymerase II subunit RPB2